MSVPSTGWLAVNQNQPPEAFLLPEEQTGTYHEGGTEITQIIGTPTESHESVGGVAVSIVTGYSPIGLNTVDIELSRSQVFGVLLLDSFLLPVLPSPGCFFVPFICTESPEGFNNETEDPDEASLICATAEVAECTPVASVEVDCHRVTRRVVVECDDDCIGEGTLVTAGLRYGDEADYGDGYAFGGDPG